jgi:hypothetical protein
MATASNFLHFDSLKIKLAGCNKLDDFAIPGFKFTSKAVLVGEVAGWVKEVCMCMHV